LSNLILATPIPNIFIDDYMPAAEPIYAALYVYAIRRYSAGDGHLEISAMADKFEIAKTKIRKCWEYWADAGLVRIIDFDDSKISLEFLNPAPKAAPVIVNEKPSALPPTKTRDLANYSVDDVSHFLLNDPEVGRLFYMVEEFFGKLLTDTERKMYLGFYEDLGLSVDVIEVLLDFCKGRNKRGRAYIKTVAIDWADRGIDTPEAATDFTRLFDNEYRQIMRAFGISGRVPVDFEIDFMEKWVTKWKMSIDMIKLACTKAIENTATSVFKYADTILEHWHNEKIDNIDKANALMKDFYQTVDDKFRKTSAPEKKRKGKTKFQNFDGREWDYDKLERLEMERQKNWKESGE